ncbi:hypothetical protein [Flavisolibacter nicotianae]|uniref:hypothetical protein n=1 Tax=Flavisolibacter nicotianae TaxID=2364882 RepID=UPI000EB0143B|nr:hypothetical protein [Flavisolibacter nicotianae]
MNRLKITLFPGDITDVHCSLLFVKHIEKSLSMPEAALNQALREDGSNVFFEKETDEARDVFTYNRLPYPIIHVINFHEDDLPFTYSSVDSYAREMIRFAMADRPGDPPVSSIATAIHGPGAGLDASEAMEKMIMGMANELQSEFPDHGLSEIIFAEKDKSVFERLQERIGFLVRKNLLQYEQSEVFLPSDVGSQQRQYIDYNQVKLKASHVFVAMPFDRNFDDVYLFGIKQAIEKNGRVSERVDQAFFTGNIVERMILRIQDAELIVADISGDNPNVFYEVGLAHGMGVAPAGAGNPEKKKIIFITQQDKIPFDIQAENCIRYDRLNIADLFEKLDKAISDVLQAVG